MKKSKNEIFDGLFVLELANNHLGDLQRGLDMVEEFSQVVRFNNVKAAIKLQFREMDSFVHPDYIGSTEVNYIKKTTEKKLTKEEYRKLIAKIISSGCLPMSTPFDEASVDFCEELKLPLIKIASSDLNDWPLIEKIAKTKIPVIVSTGGSSLKGMDDIVTFFMNRDIPIALNHCVSLYPSEDSELELNQIDFLKNRYPEIVIGLSTHEYHDWSSSILIGYAKGARTFERHIDTPREGYEPKIYNSTSSQIDTWFKAYWKAIEMCGGSGEKKRVNSTREIKYLDALVRGVYAKKDIPKGYVIKNEEFDDFFYLAVPLHKGQLSCREVKNGEVFTSKVKKNEKILIDYIDSPYARIDSLKKLIYDRGIDSLPPKENIK